MQAVFKSWENAGAGAYRYGFNGKENDNDVKGEGNQQDYGMRIYDPRLGRFLSTDPLFKDYAELTPYQFASNNPIQNIDLDGLEGLAGNMMNPGKWHVPGDANDDGIVSPSERASWGKLMALNAKLAVYGTVAIFQPEVGIPLIASDISGAPVTPSPQAFAGNVGSQTLRESEVLLEEASEPATATTGTAGNNLTKGTKSTPVENTNTQSTAANSGNNGATSANATSKPGPTLKTAGGGTINNSKWAGQFNPKALSKGFQVPVEPTGYPNFDKYLYTKIPDAPGITRSYNTVNIKMTGTYSGDFSAANKAAGFKVTPDGYTWDHTNNMGELKLIQSDAHNAARHSGGVQLYKEQHGGTGY